MPNPAITESEDYKSQFNVDQPKTNQTDELIKKLYGLKVPEPVFDQDKADRLQKMGRINQVGRSLNVLGDFVGTAIGANIKRRQPDTTSPALYQSYQANLDKYKAEKDANILRDYDKDRQDIVYGIGRADRQEGIDISQRRFEAEQKIKQAQRELEWKKYLAGLSQKERQIAIQQQNADSNRIRAERSGAKGEAKEKPEKPFMQAGSGPLTELQTRNLYDEAEKYYGGSSSDYIKGMVASYSNQPLEGIKAIVAHYLNDSKAQVNRQRIALGQGGKPSAKDDINKPKPSTTQSAPKTTKKVPSFFQ